MADPRDTAFELALPGPATGTGIARGDDLTSRMRETVDLANTKATDARHTHQPDPAHPIDSREVPPRVGRFLRTEHRSQRPALRPPRYPRAPQDQALEDPAAQHSAGMRVRLHLDRKPARHRPVPGLPR